MPFDNPFIKVTIDTDRLVDEMLAFVTDPSPHRNSREIVRVLDQLQPQSIEVLEAMVLDGTDAREDVAAYVAELFAPSSPDTEPPREEASRGGSGCAGGQPR